MPKLKTHSGAKKRFSLTKSGKVKRAMTKKRHLLNGHGNLTKTGKVKCAKANKSHILTKKTTKRTRRLRAGGYVDKTLSATVRKMIPYK